MTLKEAFKFIFHLFFAVTTIQVIVIVLVTEFVTGSGSGVGLERLIRALMLSSIIALPVFILVPGKNPSRKDTITRYIIHFIVTTIVLYGYWWITWSFSRINVIALTITYILIYVVAHTLWHKYLSRVRARKSEMEAHARSEAKSHFLAHMSHEIRTPMVSVLGIAEIQYHKSVNRIETQDAFLQIYNAANTLTDILNSILDLSKIEAGKMEINTDTFDLPSLIQDVTQLHAASLESKNFRFKVSVDERIPISLIGDEVRIRQVLNNLLSNSFKYTDAGSVMLAMKYEPSEKENHINLITTIEDSGCGMSQDQVAALQTEEFLRFSKQDRPYVHGTGLGVSIVQKLLSLMDADLTISSTLDVGTKVTVSIPLEVAGGATIGVQTAKRLEQLEAISTSLSSKAIPLPWAKILIVDDIKPNLYVLRGLLEFYNLQVETFDNATDAIEKIENGETYDIIFMDYMMPDIDGIAATEILRGMGYTNTIIALSANVFGEQQEEFLRSGFDDFLAKPIKTDALHELLIKYIKNTHAYSANTANKDDDLDEYYNRPDSQAAIKSGFLDMCSTAISDIKSAVNGGDTKTAVLTAHSAKSYALMLNESALAAISKELESALRKGEPISEEMLQTFESELSSAIGRL